MLKATALLEDVSSGQAAFHVWPASHRLFHESLLRCTFMKSQKYHTNYLFHEYLLRGVH